MKKCYVKIGGEGREYQLGGGYVKKYRDGSCGIQAFSLFEVASILNECNEK